MFEFDWSSGSIIDRETGETLKSVSYHPHADHGTVAIFDAQGLKRFEANFWNRSIDHAPTLTFPDDGVSRRVLRSAHEFDERGRPHEVFGQHKDISRMLEFYRRSAEEKTDFVGFEFIDRRKPRTPPLGQQELLAKAKEAGWVSAKAPPKASC